MKYICKLCAYVGTKSKQIKFRFYDFTSGALIYLHFFFFLFAIIVTFVTPRYKTVSGHFNII